MTFVRILDSESIAKSTADDDRPSAGFAHLSLPRTICAVLFASRMPNLGGYLCSCVTNASGVVVLVAAATALPPAGPALAADRQL